MTAIRTSDIEKALQEIEEVFVNLQKSETVLKMRYLDSQKDITDQIGNIKDILLKNLNLSLKNKAKHLDEIVVRLEFFKSELKKMSSVINCSGLISKQDIFDNLEVIINELINIENVYLESLKNLDFYNLDESPTIAFIKTHSLLPSEVNFWVFTSDYTPTLHVHDLLKIKAGCKDILNDANCLASLKCTIKFPSNNIVCELRGKPLANNMLQFQYELHTEGTYYLYVTLYGIDVAGSPAHFYVNQFGKTVDNTHERLTEAVEKLNVFSSNLQNEEFLLLNSNEYNTEKGFNLNSFDCFISSETCLAKQNFQFFFNTPTPHSFEPLKSSNASFDGSPYIFQEHGSSENLSQRIPTSSPFKSLGFDSLDKTQNCSTESIEWNSDLELDATAECVLNIKNCSHNVDNFSEGILKRNSNCKGSQIVDKSIDLLNYSHNRANKDQESKGWAVSGSQVKAKFLWRSSESLNMQFPIGVTSLQGSTDNVIICDTGNHRVIILNSSSGQLLTSFGGKGCSYGKFVRPSAVVSFEGKIAIKDEKRIQLFSQCGEYICTYEDCLSRPFGLTVDTLGRVVTLDLSRMNPSLCFFTQSGKFLQRKPFEPLSIRYQGGSKCRFLAADKENLIVVDLGANLLYGVDYNGKLNSTFSCSGYLESNFNDPAGVTIDCGGNIFVADSRNSVVKVFTKKGDFLSTVVFSKEIRRPSGIFLTEKGTFFVMNFLQHNLSAYQLE